MFPKEHALLSAAPKHIDITALKPDNAVIFLCFLHKKGIDFFLRQRMVAVCFADINTLAVIPCISQQFRRCKPVIYDAVCFFQKLHAFLGDQSRISRSCTYQIDDSHSFFLSVIDLRMMDGSDHSYTFELPGRRSLETITIYHKR